MTTGGLSGGGEAASSDDDPNSFLGYVRPQIGIRLHDGRKPVSNGRIMEGVRRALKSVGYTAKVTSISGKRTGINHAFQRQLTDRQVMILGRWRAQDTANKYTTGLAAFREEAVKKLSLDMMEGEPQQEAGGVANDNLDEGHGGEEVDQVGDGMTDEEDGELGDDTIIDEGGNWLMIQD